MQDIKDRIMHLMKTKNINATQLSEIMNVQRSGISHILSGRNKPGTDFIIKVKESFPEFSLDWLLMGKGPATLSPAPNEVKEPANRHNSTQPSLFDFTSTVETESGLERIDQANRKDKEKSTEKTDESKNKPSSQSFQNENPSSMKRDEKAIVRIIVVYSDNTFSALDPSV